LPSSPHSRRSWKPPARSVHEPMRLRPGNAPACSAPASEYLG
jgi:hypothetical protein